jgi:hypothetical protein
VETLFWCLSSKNLIMGVLSLRSSSYYSNLHRHRRLLTPILWGEIFFYHYWKGNDFLGHNILNKSHWTQIFFCTGIFECYWYTVNKCCRGGSWVRFSLYLLDPEWIFSGSRTPDLAGFLVRFSSHNPHNPCSFILIKFVIKLSPETVSSKIVVGLILNPSYYVQ